MSTAGSEAIQIKATTVLKYFSLSKFPIPAQTFPSPPLNDSIISRSILSFKASTIHSLAMRFLFLLLAIIVTSILADEDELEISEPIRVIEAVDYQCDGNSGICCTGDNHQGDGVRGDVPGSPESNLPIVFGCGSCSYAPFALHLPADLTK